MRMHILKESVTESIVVPASRESTWSVAGNPQHLASSVPMLGRFNGPKSLREGSQLTEIHTILGWPQKFRGAITAFKAQEVWAMTSAPVSVGPASLPHDVEYSFVHTQAGTRVTIHCAYARGGILRLPFGKAIVRILMSRTLRQLLRIISERAQAVRAASLLPANV